MPELNFTKSTDTEHEIKLDSALVFAAWRCGAAIGGQTARLEVGTSFVGNGAKIKIKGKTENGKKLGKIKDVITNNKYVGELEIPEDVELDDEAYFEVKLSKNGISGESNRIPCLPPPEISNMQWSESQARRGDVLTLSADVENIRPQTEVIVTIYEYDRDGAHDRTAELPTIVRSNGIELQWEYEYHEDTDEIPTEEELQEYGRNYNPPEYFFTIKVGDIEFGREQQSGLLTFKDYVELAYVNEDGTPIPNAEYRLVLADGSEQSGNLDSEGWARIDDLPPGRFTVVFLQNQD